MEAQQRCGTLTSSSYSTSTTSSSTSESSSGFDADEYSRPNPKMADFIQINRDLATKLDNLQLGSKCILDRLKHVRGSEMDLCEGEPKRFTASANESMHSYKPLVKEGLSISALKREISDLTHEKEVLVSENDSLYKDNKALASALDVSRQHYEEAISRDKASKLYAVDEDVQRLCNLSSLLNEKNERLKEYNRSLATDLRNLKEDFERLKLHNEEVSNDLASSNVQNRNLQQEMQKLMNALEKAEEEASKERVSSRSRIEAMEEELKKLTQTLHKSTEAGNVEKSKLKLEAEASKREAIEFSEEEVQPRKENIRLDTEATSLSEKLDKFEQEMSSVSAENGSLVAENTTLESEPSVRSKERKEKADLQDYTGEDIASILELRKELRDAKSQLYITTERLEAETLSKDNLIGELVFMRLKEEALVQDLRLARSYLLKMQREGEHQVPLLHTQMFCWLWERSALQEVDEAMEEEVRKLATGFSENLEKMEDELSQWRKKITGLESAVKRARCQGAVTEKKAQKLLYQISSRMPFPRDMPIAPASSALAVPGVLSCLKFKRGFQL